MEKKTENLLLELKNAIVQGKADKLETLKKRIASNKGNLNKFKQNEANPFRNTNVIILACKEKQRKILQCLLCSENKIIENVSGIILPTDEDETHHNAFYYAIRSDDCELIQMLISMWPENYFKTHNEELTEVLSCAYEELKLNNIYLSNEVKFFIEKELIDLKFNYTTQRIHNVNDYIKITKERVNMLIENVGFIREQFSKKKGVDDVCLYVLKCIVQNINVLKQKLRSTYDRLPWEEIEFSLIIFISLHCTKQEINLYLNTYVNDYEILIYLETFVKNLEYETENINALSIINLTAPVKQKRSIVVENITKRCPEFKNLYTLFENIRDICSLEEINSTVKLGLSADIKEREGKLLITRMLQVIGEYMKNTLESPKLSERTNELLLASLPKNARSLILTLRDSISHIESLCKRTEIEDNKEDSFFHGILNDLKGIGIVVADILQTKKNGIISSIKDRIRSAETINEYNKLANIFKNNFDISSFDCNYNTLVNNRIKDLLDELNGTIPDKTEHEKQLFQAIYKEYELSKANSREIELNNIMIVMSLKACFSNIKFTNNNITDLRDFKLLKMELKTKPISASFALKNIGTALYSIYASVIERNMQQYANDVRRIISHISGMLGDCDVKCIQDLEYKLKEEKLPTTFSKDKNTLTKELSKKIKDIEYILNKNRMSNKNLFECFEIYKKDTKLKSVIEMLLLDIMSIIAVLKLNIGRDLLFIDDVCPVLVGKSLRNHLAHNNELVKLVLDDPDRVIFLNAMKLIKEDLLGNNKMKNFKVEENMSCLQKRRDRYVEILNMTQLMFAVSENGNINDLKTIIKKGADVNSKSREGNGTLYFASKGDNIDILEFLLEFGKDLSLSNHELQVAVRYGRRSTVEFIIGRIGVPSASHAKKRDEVSLLHTAAMHGHKSVVEFLLQNKSYPKMYDHDGMPIHYAAQYNHKCVVEILLKNGNTINDRNIGGYSLLHIAADYGYIVLVEFLLELGADVNAKTDRDNTTPLHLATIHGHLEVVKMLILNGADVNARVLNGFSSLNYAAERNYFDIVSFLLDHGANGNNAGIMCKYTPSHIACENGFLRTVEVLLEKGVDFSSFNSFGATPMHLAVVGGHTEVFKILFAQGLDIHTMTKNNDTLLHSAAQSGRIEIASKLISSNLEINARNVNGATPLHIGAHFGHLDIVELLIKNGALIDLKTKTGSTCLHAAVSNNKIHIIEKLMKSGAKLDVKDNFGMCPLYIAISLNYFDSTAMLIKNGAAVLNNECDQNYLTPMSLAIQKGDINVIKLLISTCNVERKYFWSDALTLAVQYDRTEVVRFLITSGLNDNISRDGAKLLNLAISMNNDEIARLLIENGALRNDESIGDLLSNAIKFGRVNIVEILLKNCDSIDECLVNGKPLLLTAVETGSLKILKTVIKKIENVNVASEETGETALHIAAILGHREMIEILLDNGANVNSECGEDGTALHFAAALCADSKIVKLLLSRGADVNIEDKKKRTAIQLAVARNKLEVVKVMLSWDPQMLFSNTRDSEGLTLLHIAAQSGNIDIIRYLIDQGADINIVNNHGSKPIHHAAREGFLEIVILFLEKGCRLNETGYAGRTLLHYAVMKGHIKLVEYLVAQNANLNAQLINGGTPLHLSVMFGFKEITKILLNNGAVYNIVDEHNNKPVDMAQKRNLFLSDEIKSVNNSNVNGCNQTVSLIKSTENLLRAVKSNNVSEVKKCINEGAVLNAKDIKGNIPLFYATWKGYMQIVEVLINAKADINLCLKDESTPLHYAAKFSHTEIFKMLLANGAIYNSVNNSKSTPLDLAKDETIKEILRMVNNLFKYVTSGSNRLLIELQNIKDPGTLKAIMNARNENNKTLFMVAKLCNYSKLMELTKILMGEMFKDMGEAEMCLTRECYQEALSWYQSISNKIQSKLGPNYIVLLYIKTQIGTALYSMSKYVEALKILTDVYDFQNECLGKYFVDTMHTRSLIGLVLHRQGKNIEALDIYNDIYGKQKKILKPTNRELSNTQLNMGLVLTDLHRYEEALNLYNEMYEVWRKSKGEKDPTTLCIRNNTALVLTQLGKEDEAIQIYEEVYKIRVQVFGPHHSLTIRPLHNIAAAYMSTKRYQDAITRFRQVFAIQKEAFGLQNRDTLNTQNRIGIALFQQGKLNEALKTLKEYLRNAIPILGDEHGNVSAARILITTISKHQDMDQTNNILSHLNDMQISLNNAIENGAEQTVIDLIKSNDLDVNYVDEDGRSALYFAVYSGNIKITNILLEHSASVFCVTKKGNTLFHTAASKRYEEIFEVLLQHAQREVCAPKVIKIINTKTTISCSTPLHVAAKMGSYDIVKSLLKNGAAFDVRNKVGLMPFQVSQNQNIINLLVFVQNIFTDALNGDATNVMTKLKERNTDLVKVAMKACNSQGVTLLQVVLVRCERKVALHLVEILRNEE